MKRRRMSRRHSRKTWKNGARRVNKKNSLQYTYRGGIRL